MIKRLLPLLAALIFLLSFPAFADEEKFYEETEDGQIRINLDCTLVSNPNYERPYYRLLSSCTDENGEEWYIVGGQQIPIDALQPGDIVGKGGHVGVYIGNGLFAHALDSENGVVVDYLSHYNTLNHFDHYINVVGSWERAFLM